MSEQGQQDLVSEGATGSPKQEAVETSFSTFDLPPNVRLASVETRLDSMDTILDGIRRTIETNQADIKSNMETIFCYYQLLLLRAKSTASSEDKPTEAEREAPTKKAAQDKNLAEHSFILQKCKAKDEAKAVADLAHELETMNKTYQQKLVGKNRAYQQATQAEAQAAQGAQAAPGHDPATNHCSVLLQDEQPHALPINSVAPPALPVHSIAPPALPSLSAFLSTPAAALVVKQSHNCIH